MSLQSREVSTLNLGKTYLTFLLRFALSLMAAFVAGIAIKIYIGSAVNIRAYIMPVFAAAIFASGILSFFMVTHKKTDRPIRAALWFVFSFAILEALSFFGAVIILKNVLLVPDPPPGYLVLVAYFILLILGSYPVLWLSTRKAKKTKVVASTLPQDRPRPGVLESTKLDQETKIKSGEAFKSAIKGTPIEISMNIISWSVVLPLLYALMLCCASFDPAELAYRNSWVEMTKGFMQTLAGFIPAIGYIAADLASRGFPDRASLVTHILVSFWILFGLQFLVAAKIAFSHRDVIGRANAAVKAVQASGYKTNTVLRWLGIAILMCFFVALPFLGLSQAHGRRVNFDLANDDVGLFSFYLIFYWVWWYGAYYAVAITLSPLVSMKQKPSSSPFTP